jgi:hypothetical protein
MLMPLTNSFQHNIATLPSGAFSGSQSLDISIAEAQEPAIRTSPSWIETGLHMSPFQSEVPHIRSDGITFESHLLERLRGAHPVHLSFVIEDLVKAFQMNRKAYGVSTTLYCGMEARCKSCYDLRSVVRLSVVRLVTSMRHSCSLAGLFYQETSPCESIRLVKDGRDCSTNCSAFNSLSECRGITLVLVGVYA